MSVYEQRSRRAQAEMAAQGIDWLLITHSTDLKYMVGFAKRQSERLALFMLPREGPARMVVPSFEIPVFQAYAGSFELVGWQETENPVDKVREIVGAGSSVIAVNDHLHSIFLLRIQAALTQSTFVPGERILGKLRMHKTADEIASLRRAAEGADRSLAALFDQPLLKMTELDVIRFLHAQLLQNDHEEVGTGIVGAGPHSASPHHKTSDHPLQLGEAVVVDFGGGAGGYRSDMTRTFHLGEPSRRFRQVYEIVRQAQQLAFEAVRPGVTAESIDRVARDHITQAGYGEYFLHRTGHGIGLDSHEPPYLVSGDDTVLQEGMTFSVEPGIYIAGEFGVRIEDIVAVTAQGAERLNQSPRELKIVN
jgi:Xaa-Pro aminopeptidase